jgi:hypothetical protein
MTAEKPRPEDPKTVLTPWQVAVALGGAAAVWVLVELLMRRLP